MFLRDVSDRVQKAAPFLKLDADPYPVVINGKIEWVLDAYTTTNRFPYSQSLHPDGLSNEQRARQHLQLRAQLGEGDRRRVQRQHHLLRDRHRPTRSSAAYEKAFPKMFTSGSKVPKELRAHFRYPEDMFRAQTEQYQRYHLTNPSDFYRAGNLLVGRSRAERLRGRNGDAGDRGVERQQRRAQHAARDDGHRGSIRST